MFYMLIVFDTEYSIEPEFMILEFFAWTTIVIEKRIDSKEIK
jgi:hypothetical protein